mgnify:CR=1 FL=1
MSGVCPKCGLVQELCVCEMIAREDQRIKIAVVKRKFGKLITTVTGMNVKDVDIKDVAKRLKSKLACGGTVKDGVIELQGNHAARVREELVKMGFETSSIEVG